VEGSLSFAVLDIEVWLPGEQVAERNLRMTITGPVERSRPAIILCIHVNFESLKDVQ